MIYAFYITEKLKARRRHGVLSCFLQNDTWKADDKSSILHVHVLSACTVNRRQFID